MPTNMKKTDTFTGVKTMRGASYSEKQMLLSYWFTPNQTTFVDADTFEEASTIVEGSGIEQQLRRVDYFETSGKPIGG